MYAWLVVFNQAQKFASIQVQVKAPEGPQRQITVSKTRQKPTGNSTNFFVATIYRIEAIKYRACAGINIYKPTLKAVKHSHFGSLTLLNRMIICSTEGQRWQRLATSWLEPHVGIVAHFLGLFQ